MTTGRNDPCHCGSGKKYKHCCLVADETPPSAAFLWRKLQQANEGLVMRLLDCAVEVFGREAIYEAWDEFTLWQDVPFDPESPHVQVFWPWFYYDWYPDPDDTQVNHGAPMDLTIAGAYLRRNIKRVDPLQCRYLEACQQAPFSFHEVVACDPGKGFLLRDILSGDERQVIERSGSENARPGDMLFGKVVVLDELAELDGCSPVLIPPIEKAPILALRDHMAKTGQPITRDFIKEYDLEMFGIYHEVVERLLNPPMPELRNTDGDLLLFHKLLYDIDSPQAAFDALKELALDATEEDLLASAERDPNSALQKVEFSWRKRGNKLHKHWDNTILGHIRIEDNTLTVEVNSGKRAKKFASLAKKLLGNHARYRTTVIESPESMLSRDEGKPLPGPDEALMSDPAVQAQIAQFLEAHYENWLNEKLPALGNKTPRQAVKTPQGREMVEALLTQFKRDMREQEVPGAEAIVHGLRQRLNLT